jgi:hypothetical protein
MAVYFQFECQYGSSQNVQVGILQVFHPDCYNFQLDLRSRRFLPPGDLTIKSNQKKQM